MENKNIDWNYCDMSWLTNDDEDKNNISTSLKNEVDVDERVRSSIKFYGRHVENLKCVDQGTPNWFLEGDSPLGGDTIIIDQGSNWYCNATNQGGDEIDFLSKQDPLLTKTGAGCAWRDEIMNTPDFDHKIILDEFNIHHYIKLYRKELSSKNNISDFGKSVIMKNNFWSKGTPRFYFVELSRTGKPLCRYDFTMGESFKMDHCLMCGVPRIREHHDSDRIYFVDNPLQLIFIKEIVSDPVYVKPDYSLYPYNDYLKMVEGKDIVHCLTNEFYPEKIGNWDFELIKRGDRASAKSFFEDNL